MQTPTLKILLIKRGAIGDLLMATPLIRQLKIKTSCQLDILVGKSAAVVLANNPYIDKKYLVADEDFSVKGFFRLGRQLCKIRGNYDYVFILDKHWYFNLMAKFLGAVTIGYRRDFISQVLLTKYVVYNEITRYQGLYYLDLLKISMLAHADYSDVALDLIVSDADKRVVEELLLKHKIQDFSIVVNSGGNSAHETGGIRMLPTVKVIELLNVLLEKNQNIVLLGGQNDESNYNEYTTKLNHPSELFNFAGKLTITQSAYMISLADQLYTTDCGVMHVGVAMTLGVKMHVFFGPTNPAHFLPQEYLKNKVAIWGDEDIYTPAYSLRGIKNRATYFTRLNISKFISSV